MIIKIKLFKVLDKHQNDNTYKIYPKVQLLDTINTFLKYKNIVELIKNIIN